RSTCSQSTKSSKRISDYSCSEVRTRPFHNIELQNVIAMIHLLDSLRLRKKSLVRARFEERARHFDETLMFLEAVGCVTESAESLALTDSELASVRWPADANTTRR